MPLAWRLSLQFLAILLLARCWSIQALSVDPTVVTDLRVVRGASLEEAREACAAMCPCRQSLTKHVTSNWFLVGTNLNTATTAANAETDAYVYLCMRQDRRAPLERNNAVLFAIQSIAVLEQSRCPSSMKRLFAPRPGVVVCMQRVQLKLALATGTYISDVGAVKASDLNVSSANDGWTSLSTSAHTDAASPDVFIRYKRPQQPILGVRMLRKVGRRTSDASACRAQLNETWEPAGSAYRSDGGSSLKRGVVCILRAHVPVDSVAPPTAVVPPRVLAQVSLTDLSQPCLSGFQEQIELSARWKACLRFEDGDSPEFVTYLQIVTKRVGDPTPWPADLSHASINHSDDTHSSFHLIYQEAQLAQKRRQLQPQERKDTSNNQAKPISQKPPLYARQTPDTTTAAKSQLTFKILQLADLHLTGDPDHFCRAPPVEHARCGMQCTESLTSAFVNDLLDAEKPDLVVFSGDTVTVPKWELKEPAVTAALKPVEDRNIPYAYIMGNHDDDYVFSRQEIMDILVKRDLAYAESGPSTIQGVGNYELNIKAPSNGTWGKEGDTVFRMYFLDSNKNHDQKAFPNIKSRYDWIRENQIEFYRNLSLGHRQAGQPALPAIMFFHIPIPEYGGIGSYLFPNGEKNEKTEGPDYNSGLLSTLVEMDEVKATFVGHDHTNEYCYKRRGVQLCYGGGAGFGPVYDGSVARRARVIEWSIDGQNRRQIKSWKRHFGSKFHERHRREVLYRES